MPKLVCECGFVHNLSNIPDDGFVVIKDKDYESLIDLELKNISDNLPQEETTEWNEQVGRMAQIINLTERLYECPDCRRIIWKRNNEQLHYYNPISQ